MTELTFSYIKPDCCSKYKDEILKIINDHGFKIIKSKEALISNEMTLSLFKNKKNKWGTEKFEKYIKFMTSGKVFAMILEKENAISDFRNLMGDDPDPLKNPLNSIRRKFGSCALKNSIHGSKSKEKMIFESSHFF